MQSYVLCIFFSPMTTGKYLFFFFICREIWTCILIHNYKILFEKYWWPWKGPLCMVVNWRLLAAGVLGDSFGSFADGVLGQFSWQEKTDSGLDLPRCDGGSLVVVGQSWGFGGNSFEDVVDEAVHDGHGLGAHTSVGVDLSQDFVNVDSVGFLPPPLPFLVSASTGGFGLGDGLLGTFRSGLRFGWHIR